jgi:thioesterase domain-containing protein
LSTSWWRLGSITQYAGKITSFEAEDHDDHGGDPAQLWRALATEIERRTIPDTHLSILTEDESLARLAAALDPSLCA